jgi:hypothetical protein
VSSFTACPPLVRFRTNPLLSFLSDCDGTNAAMMSWCYWQDFDWFQGCKCSLLSLCYNTFLNGDKASIVLWNLSNL